MTFSNSGAAILAAPPAMQSALLEINPNRRYLDDRFPVLGFTLVCGRAGFYEVLLATDHTLFDPAQSGRRSGANFYSSRQDSKLVPMSARQAVYLVPAAVLKSFASAQSGSFEIYYAAVSYSTADGKDPIFSQPPDMLSKSAPSVPVSASFRGHAVPVAFGLSVRGATGAHNSNGHAVLSAAASVAVDPNEDRGEGEDGSWVSPLEARPLQNGSHRNHSSNGRKQQSASSASAHYDDGYSAKEEVPSPSSTPHSAGALRYSDGYDADDDSRSMAMSQSAEFAAGTPEPMPLATGYDDDDDEEDRRSSFHLYTTQGQEHAAVRYKPAPQAEAASYGDEADEWDTESLPPYRALDAHGQTPAAQIAAQLTIETKRDLIRKLGEYSAVVADGEFEGDYGNKHPAYHRFHRGLSYGVVLFNQDDGDLGKLLSMMKQRNEGRFREVFGEAADELLKMTNATGPSSKESPGGRSVRVQPVSTADLWTQPWLSMFQQAGDEMSFQAAQNQLASALFLDPILSFAAMLGFKTERLLAALVTCASAMGLETAKQWIVNTVSPVQTPAQRQQAFAALKQKDVTSFQKNTAGLEATGHWDPDTQAAVVQALRSLASPPLPVGTPDQMLVAIVRRSSGTPWAERLQHIHDANEFNDAELGF